MPDTADDLILVSRVRSLSTCAPEWVGTPRPARIRRWAYLTAALVVGLLAMLQIQTRRALADSGTAHPISAMNGWSLHGLSATALNAQLALMESEGVTALRVDASWSSIQPNAPGATGPVYTFNREDSVVAALAEHHIEWLPIVDYSAPWAATTVGDWRSPPANDSQFVMFAGAIAARYGVGGTFWAQHPQLPYEPVHTFEIWNEENADYFWDTGPNPAAYARLYLAARAAIHAVDSQAVVMVGGLTNPQQGTSALAYLTQMFQEVPALAGNVDAVGLHPYAANANGVVNTVVGIRTLLDSVDESSVAIDVTEFGWRTAGAAAEQQRATMMKAVALALGHSNCGIGLLAPYDWMDPSYITTGDWGLAGTSGVRPAGTAWFAGLSIAAASAQTQLCPAGASRAPAATPTTDAGSKVGPRAPRRATAKAAKTAHTSRHKRAKRSKHRTSVHRG